MCVTRGEFDKGESVMDMNLEDEKRGTESLYTCFNPSSSLEDLTFSADNVETFAEMDIQISKDKLWKDQVRLLIWSV